jgi:YesN/AraC family two-component response regulator
LALLQRLLSDVYIVHTASSGQEALDILQQETIAVVISDQRMPGMTGVQLMEQIRRISPNTLGILSSGYSEAQVLSAALNLGTVRGFIPKPWVDTEVRRRVYEAVQQYLTLTGRSDT